MATGGKDFNKKFQSAAGRMRDGAIKGLRLGVKLIEAEAKKRSAVDEGNLKGGNYSTVQVSRSRAIGEIGNTAEYAAAVHEIENPSSGVKRKGKDAKGNYWDNGEPKFLENAIEDKIDEVMALIRKLAKIA